MTANDQQIGANRPGLTQDLVESEFLVLLGPSGSGKSTLLNILRRLDVATFGIVQYRHVLTNADKRALTELLWKNATAEQP